MKKMKVSVVTGTRPEIIKMSSVIRELEWGNFSFFILHTGQHYSYYLDKIFFKELELPEPKYNLEVGSGSHAWQTGKILIGIEKILLEEKPDVVLVEGDTNSVLAGALAAAKLDINVGHIEAGLRSNDKNMPEELNRILTDHLSDYLFAPTDKARDNLISEGIHTENIYITGNTIVDAVHQNAKIAQRKSQVLDELGLKQREYFLVTVHRQENVELEERMKGILEGLGLVYQKFRLALIYPIHPRASRSIKKFGLEIPSGVKLIEPVGFLDFLTLETNAALILTDSGGIQEESCILNVPCVTLRDSTERPETIEAGSNVLAGASPEVILNSVKRMLPVKREWQNPFGDGKTGNRIVNILIDRF
ncbi:non-hydrolyzing UDP-N-acetylglucosamine 2-epimerase [Chloroflexota bacterium]